MTTWTATLPTQTFRVRSSRFRSADIAKRLAVDSNWTAPLVDFRLNAGADRAIYTHKLTGQMIRVHQVEEGVYDIRTTLKNAYAVLKLEGWNPQRRMPTSYREPQPKPAYAGNLAAQPA